MTADARLSTAKWGVMREIYVAGSEIGNNA
jgi:hypothetical protein